MRAKVPGRIVPFARSWSIAFRVTLRLGLSADSCFKNPIARELASVLQSASVQVENVVAKAVVFEITKTAAMPHEDVRMLQ